MISTGSFSQYQLNNTSIISNLSSLSRSSKYVSINDFGSNNILCFGVLQPTAIAGWNALDGNFATGEVKTTVSASYGIGSQFVSVLDSAALDLESDLKFEREKLEKIKEQIAALELELKTKANYQYPITLLPDIRLGLYRLFAQSS